MKYTLIAGSIVVAGLVAGAAALAEQRHRHDHNMDDFPAMHAQMCQDQSAREAGRVAYIEARLSLNESQEKLFTDWKNGVLQDAAARAKTCASFAPPSTPPDLLGRMAHEEEMLKGRLASLEGQMPALSALYQSLSPEQKEVFDRGGMHEGHGGWFGHEHGERDGDHDRDHDSDHGHHGDDDDHGA